MSVDAAPAAPPALRRGLLVLLVLLALVTSAIAVANIVLGIALLVWIVALRREGRFRAPFQPAIVFWVGIFVACGVASAVFSLHPRSSLVAIKGSFTYLVLRFLPTRSSGEVRRVVAALGGAGWCLPSSGSAVSPRRQPSRR